MAFKILRLEVGLLKTNCYILYDSDTKESLIVDPGDDGEYVKQVISDSSLIPKMIIATHGHFDHLLAAYELRLVYGVPFRLNERDAFLLSRTRSSTRYFTGFDPGKIDLTIDQFLANNETVTFGSCQLKVLATPGHTPGSVSLVSLEKRCLFSGDLIFKDGLGRTDFKYGCQKDLLSSLSLVTDKVLGYQVFPGHGERFILSEIGS